MGKIGEAPYQHFSYLISHKYQSPSCFHSLGIGCHGCCKKLIEVQFYYKIVNKNSCKAKNLGLLVKGEHSQPRGSTSVYWMESKQRWQLHKKIK